MDLIQPHMDITTEASRYRELSECIYWRKGALLYMYCHTSYNNQSAKLIDQNDKNLFISYAVDGKCVLYADC